VKTSIFEVMLDMAEEFPKPIQKTHHCRCGVICPTLAKISSMNYQPQVVFHAAAQQARSLMEKMSPMPISNNVIGTAQCG